MSKTASRQCGFSLIEVLVSIALLSVVAGASYAVATLYSRMDYRLQFLNSRNLLANDIRRMINSKTVLVASMKLRDATGARTNSQLHGCLCGVGTCTTYETPFRELSLVDTEGKRIAPAYYDQGGYACDPTIQQCTFLVKTRFLAECAPNFLAGSQDPVVTCVGQPAEFIAINYSIEKLTPQSTEDANVRPVSGWTFLDSTRVKLEPGDCI